MSGVRQTFSIIGVLASLTAPLDESGVSVVVISTFDTDYLLVTEHDYEKAVFAALQKVGHSIRK